MNVACGSVKAGAAVAAGGGVDDLLCLPRAQRLMRAAKELEQEFAWPGPDWIVKGIINVCVCVWIDA